jgi:hypothetical protein
MRFSEFIKKEEASYIDSLKNQLGIHPDDQKKDPKIASWISLGSMKNIGPYIIIDYKKNSDGKITHALIKQNNDSNNISINYSTDNSVIKNNDKDKTFLISIEDLENQIMLQGQNQQANPSGGIA